MKRLIKISAIAITAMFVLAQTVTSPLLANTKMRLIWNANDPAESVEFYTVYVAGTNGSRNVSTTNTVIDLKTVFATLKNGTYSIEITANGVSGQESDRSIPLWVFWFGNKPSRPNGLLVEFLK